MSSPNNEYTPGVCNIGPSEVRWRLALGWTGTIIWAALWIALAYWKAPLAWRLTLFAPAFLAAMGFLQAKRGFCAKYGLAGMFNIGPIVGQTETVADPDARRHDRNTSLRILATAAAIAIVATIAAIWWPPA